MCLKVVATGGALGAEIIGVDFTKEMDDATFNQVRQAFYEHEVVIFRNQELSDDDHIRFSARFGELRKQKARTEKYPRRPELTVVSNIIEEGQPIGQYDAGRFWHTDGAYVKNPHAVSLLHAIEVPQKDGRPLGATDFASMTAAYDALTPSMKKRIDGLQAVHSLVLRRERTLESGLTRPELNEEQKKSPEAVHPVVRLHPTTSGECVISQVIHPTDTCCIHCPRPEKELDIHNHA